LVEIVAGHGAPLRAWARIGEGDETLLVSPTSLAIAGAAPGQTVELRAARRTPEV